mmetsp:Transcript_30897/g.97436  ORF Transcript_30897/g.97436 Transcript_30897/m.97436 type:complete len:212 (+) Transcript_30897:57-692(+)
MGCRRVGKAHHFAADAGRLSVSAQHTALRALSASHLERRRRREPLPRPRGPARGRREGRRREGIPHPRQRRPRCGVHRLCHQLVLWGGVRRREPRLVPPLRPAQHARPRNLWPKQHEVPRQAHRPRDGRPLPRSWRGVGLLDHLRGGAGPHRTRQRRRAASRPPKQTTSATCAIAAPAGRWSRDARECNRRWARTRRRRAGLSGRRGGAQR